jgi:hypothetical protein
MPAVRQSRPATARQPWLSNRLLFSRRLERSSALA